MHRLVAVVFASLAACSSGTNIQSATAALPRESAEIDPMELRRDLLAFADDSMRGRETGTADADRAMRFLVARVRALGLEPAGDSLFVQHVPLVRQTFSTASRVTVWGGSRAASLRLGRDVVPLLNLGEGVPPTRRTAEGQIVFDGYGVATPTRDADDNLDLEDKVVVVVNGAWPTADLATRARRESLEAIGDHLAHILPQRPAAVVILLQETARALFDQIASQLERSISLRSRAPEVPESDRQIPMILLGIATPGSPLLPIDWPRDDRPQPLPTRLSAHLEQQSVPLMGYNVAAVVRGSDPGLSQTYVAYGAHYDHIGVVAPVRGDSIANGADDDGSGSVSLLAIARTIQSAVVKPKRSILFIWHVGEEKGLLGSRWFVDHPTVPIDSIVAQINADMIGRNAPDLLYVVGPHAAPNALNRRLGAIVDSVNASEPRHFTIDRSMDSENHPEHIYERSDHFNYARKGIPIAFFTTGLHADYHTPSDDVSRIDFDKLARVGRLLRDVGMSVANSVNRPN